MKKILILIYISIIISSCAWVQDFPRTAWGSSIRVLSAKRSEAASDVFLCDREKCFDFVVGLTRPFGSKEEGDSGKVILFAKDPKKNYLIVMGVPGNVDTTEVGVFFDQLPDQQTRIEISSLSLRAKDAAAEMIFKRISEVCAPVR